MTADAGPDSPVGLLLRRAACVDDDGTARDAIRRACLEVGDWDRAIDQAELHGLSPWLHRQLTRAEADVPVNAARQLKSLTLRHREANRIRDRALTGILQALAERGVEVLVLKGAALAHLVYDPPGLRPMSDVDILVAPDRLEDAAEAVRSLGYQESSRAETGPDHHHLPALSRLLDGLSISVEIHHDAMAQDNIGSIRLDRLAGPPREFHINGTAARALGHVDMLRHLWRHALQPRGTTKLGSALDIMLYASRFQDEIDWRWIERQAPDIRTGLSLLALLVPLPRNLNGRVAVPDIPVPAGVGVGMAPLSTIRRDSKRAAKLLNPSDWWLHGFYNVPLGHSLVLTKTVRHPARILFWLWRRLVR